MIHTQEFRDKLYALRNEKTAKEIAAEFGLTTPAVWKIWAREKAKRGDERLRKTKTNPHAQEIYALRGLKSNALIAQQFGVSMGVVAGIMARERRRRGDPVLKAPPKVKIKHNGPATKYSQAFVDTLYGLRGEIPASQIAKQFGLTKAIVCALWRRECQRRNDQSPIRRKFQIKGRPKLEITRRRVTLEQRIDPAKPGVGMRIFQPQTFSLRDVVAMPINDGQGVSLFDRTSCQCAYPLGDFNAPATFFCGAVTLEGKSYCGPHYALCTAPAVVNEERLAA